MGLRIDTQYCNYVSMRLDLFKWVRPNLAVARCPFCGDSNIKKSKKRFYIYQRSTGGTLNDGLSAHCHNCGYSQPFGKFLSEFDTAYYNQYRTELFKDRHKPREFKAKPVKPVETVKFVQVVYEKQLEPIGLATRCDELPEEHIAVQYLKYRQIVDPKKFWFTEDFKQTASSFNNLSSLVNMNDGEPRLIIPFYDEQGKLQCIQGRTLGESKSIKYLTVKRTEESSKVYGLNNLDRKLPVLVVEGPIDSLFLPNCIATADSNLLAVDYGDVYIPDNQYRNREICRRMQDIINAGKSIVLWPQEIQEKDINAMIMSGINKEDLWEVIKQNTFKGLTAKLRLSRLKMC